MAKKAATTSEPQKTPPKAKVAPRRGDMKFFTDHDHQAAADYAYGQQTGNSSTAAKSQRSDDWTPETD